MQGEADTVTEDICECLRSQPPRLDHPASRRPPTPRHHRRHRKRISDYANYPEGSKTVREAKWPWLESDPKAAWIDTDDLNGKRDDLHYTKDGYVTLGERFADKAIELINSTKK